MEQLSYLEIDGKQLEIVDESARYTAETAKNTAETAKNTAESAKNTAESAKNTAESAKNTAESAKSAAETATAIAKGRNQAHVFSTTEAMKTWLSNEENKGLYNKGDNIYIVDVGVPDWWIAEMLDAVDEETGYYYKIAQLETQKVDLTEIIKLLGNTDISDIADGTVTGAIDEVNSNLSSLLKVEKIEFSGNYTEGENTLILSKDIGDYKIIALSTIYDSSGIFSIDRWDIQNDNTIRLNIKVAVDHDDNGYVNVLCIKK